MKPGIVTPFEHTLHLIREGKLEIDNDEYINIYVRYESKEQHDDLADAIGYMLYSMEREVKPLPWWKLLLNKIKFWFTRIYMAALQNNK